MHVMVVDHPSSSSRSAYVCLNVSMKVLNESEKASNLRLELQQQRDITGAIEKDTGHLQGGEKMQR